MSVKAEISNNSNKRVKRVEAYLQQVWYTCKQLQQLVQNIIYSTSKGGQKFVKGDAKMAQVTQGPIASGDVQIWDQCIIIPALPPSKLGNCRQIAVDYLFNVCCKYIYQIMLLYSLSYMLKMVKIYV